MRAWLFLCLALPALPFAEKVGLDPPNVEYAKPWTKGVNVCAYIARPGLLKYKVWSYCLPWKQDYCGTKSSFKYDCCPGFKRTPAFSNKCVERERTWKNIPDLLKIRGHPKFSQLLTSKKNGAGYTPLTSNNDRNTFTVFVPYDDSPKTLGKLISKGRGKNHPILFHVVKTRIYSDELINGKVLQSEFNNQKLKVTKYSNGIICVECREFVEPDHEAKNGVIHYISGGMIPIFGNNANRKSLFALLMQKRQTSHFANYMPIDIRRLLMQVSAERQWYTVFVPTRRAWSETLKKYKGKTKILADIVRTHIVKQLYCSAALIGNNQDLGISQSGEPIRVTCGPDGKRYVTTRLGPKGAVVAPDGMAPNGVYHVINNTLIPSSAMSLKNIVDSDKLPDLIGSSLWPKLLKECDLRMEKSKSYAVLIPNQRAFDWWEKYPRFKKYYQRFLTDKAFRCRLARFHIATMKGGKESTLPLLKLQQEGYPTTNKDKQWEVDYFLKRDYGSQLHFHYSPVYPFKSVKFDRGSVYFLDRVNMIPEKRLVNVLADTPYLKTMSDKTKTAKMDKNVFKKNEPLNLYLAIRNKGWQGTSKASTDARKYKKVSLTNFLLLHYVKNWLWGGDIGYFERGTRHRFMSGVGKELIFDRDNKGTMYIGYKGLPRKEWPKVVEWNLFAIDGNIWVLDRPLVCPKKLCSKTKILEKEVWKVLSFACWESLRAVRGAKASQLEPWLATVDGNQCFTNKNTPKAEESTHAEK